MNAFSAAADAIFADPNFRVDATYTPPGGGAGVDCIMIIDGREEGVEHGQGRPRAGQVTLQVRKSQVAAPAKDGTFAVLAQDNHPSPRTYVVMDKPQPWDADVLVWSMWAR